VKLARPPLLIPRDEIIPLKRAVDDTGRSADTIRGYNRKHCIARETCPNAPLEISAVALQMVIHGDYEALELLHRGERSHPPWYGTAGFLGCRNDSKNTMPGWPRW
jgi:hypothetical protein